MDQNDGKEAKFSMLRLVKASMIVPIALAFILSVSLLPLLLQLDGDGGSLRLHWSQSFAALSDYLGGLGSGDSFRFVSGKNEYSFWERIGASFKVSFFYISAGSLLGMTLGLIIGVYFALSTAEWLTRIVELLGALPDFVMIMLLQVAVVFIASKTGAVVFQVASLSTDDPAIALPLLSATIIPANYMIRNVAMQMKLTLSEDYIGFAKARGLSRMRIVFHHALPNVLPFFKADLHKLLGILMGNIFVVEYLYNLNGVTMFLFSDAFGFGGYQYALVVNGLMTLIVLYAVVYALIRLYLWGWEKVIAR
jgi:peptide/nickel transport system permease protein